MPIGTIRVELIFSHPTGKASGSGICTTRGSQDIGGGTNPLWDRDKMVV